MTGKRFHTHTSTAIGANVVKQKLYGGEKIFAQSVESSLSAVEPAGPVSVPLIIPPHETPRIAQEGDCGSMPRRKTDDIITGDRPAPPTTIPYDLRRFKQCQFHLDNSPPVFYGGTADSSGPPQGKSQPVMTQYEPNAYTFYPPTRWSGAQPRDQRQSFG
jgi:hypothetical protein